VQRRGVKHPALVRWPVHAARELDRTPGAEVALEDLAVIANGSTRTLTVTGCSTGTLLPAFAATGAQDLAGNLGPATEQNAATTITIDRAAPTLSNFALAGTEGATMYFSPSSFAAPFSDDRALEPSSIIIKTLPSSGVLWLGSSPVTLNQEIPYNDLGQLSYVPVDYANGTFTFTVTVSDGVNATNEPSTSWRDDHSDGRFRQIIPQSRWLQCTPARGVAHNPSIARRRLKGACVDMHTPRCEVGL
jgi:hypothetical protein